MGRYHPWRDLRDNHPEIEVDRRWKLPGDFKALWIGNCIYLHRELKQAGRRCQLTHELIHRGRGPSPVDDPWLEGKEERIVRHLTARRLISIDDFIDAYVWSGQTIGTECAMELWVDLSTLRDYVEALTPAERIYIHKCLRERDHP